VHPPFPPNTTSITTTQLHQSRSLLDDYYNPSRSFLNNRYNTERPPACTLNLPSPPHALCPSHAGCPSDYWARFEQCVRDLTQHAGSVFVVTGPLWLPRRHVDGRWFMQHAMIGAVVAVPCSML